MNGRVWRILGGREMHLVANPAVVSTEQTGSRSWTPLLPLAAILIIPLLLVAYKSSGLPGAEWLRLNLTLESVSPEFHRRVNYLIFVPLGALIVVFFRIVLGIRLLGPFRSVLLAVALQVTGIGTGLIFLLAVTVVTTAIYPVLNVLKMPYFARVSTLLSVVAAVMLAALMIGDRMQSATLQYVAYFPVVVLCLTAYGFARSTHVEGIWLALWRGSMTVVAAVLISGIARIPAIGASLVSYPELLIAEIGIILIMSQFLGFRVFDAINPKPKRGKSSEESSAPITPVRSLGRNLEGDLDSAYQQIEPPTQREGST